MGIRYTLFCALHQMTAGKENRKEAADRLRRMAQDPERSFGGWCTDVPSDETFLCSKVRIRSVCGEERRKEIFSCLRMNLTGKMKHRRALLYVAGVNLPQGAQKESVRFARDLGKQSSRDVWYPCYPTMPDYSILDSVEMVLETYRQMLEEYRPDDIAFYGYSLGAMVAISTLGYNNSAFIEGRRKVRLPMPSMLLLVSPAAVPSDGSEWRQMKLLERKDIMMEADYVYMMRDVLCAGRPDVPRFMLSGDRLDTTDFPETYIWYGGDEILSAKKKTWVSDFEVIPDRLHIRTAPGMCHSYCIAVRFPEAQRDYREAVHILSGSGGR